MYTQSFPSLHFLPEKKYYACNISIKVVSLYYQHMSHMAELHNLGHGIFLAVIFQILSNKFGVENNRYIWKIQIRVNLDIVNCIQYFVALYLLICKLNIQPTYDIKYLIKLYETWTNKSIASFYLLGDMKNWSQAFHKILLFMLISIFLIGYIIFKTIIYFLSLCFLLYFDKLFH